MCKEDGCEYPGKGQGLCMKHYMRLRRNGKWTRMPAPQVSPCAADGCPTEGTRKYCPMHYQRKRKTGAAHNAAYGHSLHVGYSAVHVRLREQRGKADTLMCRCGDQADQWAYDHTDPDQGYNDKGMPFSQDLERYTPMCLPCHSSFDYRRNSR